MKLFEVKSKVEFLNVVQTSQHSASGCMVDWCLMRWPLTTGSAVTCY